ncbi:MAG: ATP-binding protein [Vicinamibacteraceae bacterium]
MRAVVCNYRDVSRRRAAEEATQVAARRFRAVFEGARDGLVIADDQTHSVAANSVALALLGTTQDVLSRDGLASFAPALAGQPSAPGAGVARGATDAFQLCRSDGTMRDVELSAANILPGQHLSVLRDVTGRKAAERRGAEAQDRFAAIFANSPTAMFIYDCGSGHIVEANTEFERLTEHARRDSIGRSCSDLGLWAAVGAENVMLTSPDVVRARQARLVRRTGEPRDVLLSVERLDGREHRDRLRVALLTDVTEHNLLETQLRQSQKMEAIGQLAGGVAHDFNNLLTVILGYAAFLSNRPELPLDAVTDAREILKAGQTAASLTQRLLAFSRRTTFAPGIVDVNQLITGIHTLLARLIGDGIEMDMKLAANLRQIVADAPELEQILINLTVNARDAMPTGGRLLIETADVDLDAAFVALHRGAVVGPHVMIAVSDTGSGMNDAVKARAFEPFFTTKPSGKGTGLGLSSVYAAVKQGHGSISIDSEPGQGSTFHIYLPASEEPRGRVCAAEPATTRSGSEAILLVEDDESVRELVHEILSRQGYAVTAAAGPKEGLEILSGHGPLDLLLTDLTMPHMGGREFARLCQTQRADLRVLYMTGHAEPLAEDGELHPGLALIEKPFVGRALLERVRAVLDAPSASA